MNNELWTINNLLTLHFLVKKLASTKCAAKIDLKWIAIRHKTINLSYLSIVRLYHTKCEYKIDFDRFLFCFFLRFDGNDLEQGVQWGTDNMDTMLK